MTGPVWPVDATAGPHDRRLVTDALAVAAHLDIGQFVTVGTSPGGAFALALAALAAAVSAHGEDCSKLRGDGMAAALVPSDLALFRDPRSMAEAAGISAMFACPVTVLHGGSDRIVDVIHARHTAELIPSADLVIVDDLGHFSIVAEVLPAIAKMLRH